MAEITIDETKVKELLKTAILELIQEKPEELSEFLAEALEDFGIKNAINEGEETEKVSRDRIFQILNKQK